MAKVRESAVVAWVESELRRVGAYFVNVHGSTFSSSGTADILACLDGNFVACEVKRSGNKPSIAQLGHGLEVLAAGGRFVVAYEDFEVDKLLAGSLPCLSVGELDKFSAYDTLDFLNRTTELVL